MADQNPPPVLAVTRGKAADVLGVHRRTIDRLIEDGSLRLTADNKVNAEDVRRLSGEGIEGTGAPAAGEDPIIAAHRYSMKHTEDFTRILVASCTTLFSHYQTELAQARAQQDLMVQRWLEGMRLSEESKQRNHERELEVLDAKRSAEMKETALALVKDAMPRLLAQVGGSGSNEQVKAVIAALESLTDEQIGLFREMGILTPAQLELVAKLRGKPLPPTLAELEAAEKGGNDGDEAAAE